MKPRYFIAAAMVSLSLMASAEQTGAEPIYMVLTMNDGTLQATNISQISKLTFSNGKMNVEKPGASAQDVAVADIKLMEFSYSPTGAALSTSTVERTGLLSYSREASVIAFDGVEGATLAVCDANGRLILRHVTAAGAQSLNIAELPAGVYIVSYNGQSLKIAK